MNLDIFDDLEELGPQSTERTLRALAKTFASIYYENYDFKDPRMDRTKATADRIHAAFYRKYPNLKDFLRNHMHNPDGSISIGERPNWMSFIEVARSYMIAKLGDKNTQEWEKDALYKALLEDREKQYRNEAKGKHVHQRKGIMTSDGSELGATLKKYV